MFRLLRSDPLAWSLVLWTVVMLVGQILLWWTRGWRIVG